MERSASTSPTVSGVNAFTTKKHKNFMPIYKHVEHKYQCHNSQQTVLIIVID